jgi:hypothetical protein
VTEHITVRLVVSHEDATAEAAAVPDTGDYRLGQATPIARDGGNLPLDASLRDSLPAGDELLEARFIDPVTITATLTLATLAVRLVNHWMKSNEAGVQIDTRTTPATISRLAGVPNGTLAIINPDDTTTLVREAYDDPEDVIPKLAPLFA